MLPQFAPGPALLEALPQAPLRDDLGGQLAPFEPVSLAEMDSVALFERRDTKFVLSETRLAAFLEALAGRYRVLEIDINKRVAEALKFGLGSVIGPPASEPIEGLADHSTLDSALRAASAGTKIRRAA